MHITAEEAVSLLNSWSSEQTVLRVCFSKPGANTEAHGRITGVSGKTVMMDSDSGKMEISLYDAEFNGDSRAPAGSSHGAYLICEFRNDDRWAFYAPRQSNAKNPIIERRT
jgi:hypothetical protein